MYTLALLLVMSNAIFISLTHPLSMGLMLMMQTLLIAFFASMFMNSFWYSYILILVFLGGMLIIFIYVASIASNEILNLRMKSMISGLLLILISVLLPSFFSSKLNIANDNWFSDSPFMWQFSGPLITLSSFLVIYLFFVLVAIVKITKFWSGAFRKLDQ